MYRSPELSSTIASYDYLPSTPSPMDTPPSLGNSCGIAYHGPIIRATFLIHLVDTSISIGSLLFVDGLDVDRVMHAYRMV